MKNATRPAIFKWRQRALELILCAARWYLRYSLSFRDVEELLTERGLAADHTTIWRWVQRYGPELEQRLRRHLKPTNKSWRVDETGCVASLKTVTETTTRGTGRRGLKPRDRRDGRRIGSADRRHLGRPSAPVPCRSCGWPRNRQSFAARRRTDESPAWLSLGV